MTRLTPWLAVFAALIALGQRAPLHGVEAETACLQAQLAHDAPAPDILFVGNSTMGAAVDPAFVEASLSERLRRPVTVERLINLGPNLFKYPLDLSAYVESRGWPRVLVLNLFVNLRAPSAYAERPLFEVKSLKLHDWSRLREVKNGFFEAYRGSKVERVLERSWYNDVELLLFKAGDFVYRALELPASRLLPADPCPSLGGFTSLPRYQPYDRLRAGRVYGEANGLITPPPGNLRIERDKAASLYPPGIDSPARDLEFAQMRALIERAVENGARVLVTQVPILDWPDLGPGDRSAIAARLPRATYVDSFRMFDLPIAAAYADNAFLNMYHVNYNGAHLFSSFWIERLAAELDA